MSRCEHPDFAAVVAVHRLTDDAGKVTAYQAEIKIRCTACRKPFQFLGLEPGTDNQGARVSVDGLEARLALCPRGEVPSPLDRLAVNFRPSATH